VCEALGVGIASAGEPKLTSPSVKNRGPPLCPSTELMPKRWQNVFSNAEVGSRWGGACGVGIRSIRSQRGPIVEAKQVVAYKPLNRGVIVHARTAARLNQQRGGSGCSPTNGLPGAARQAAFERIELRRAGMSFLWLRHASV